MLLMLVKFLLNVSKELKTFCTLFQITPPKDETKRAVNSAAYRTLSDWNELTADLEDQVKVNTLKQSFSEMQLAHKIENVDLSICTKKISHWSLQPKPKQMQHHRRPFME